MFSDRNPFMKPVQAAADAVHANRAPVDANNPWLQVERAFSQAMFASLESWTQLRDQFQEAAFFAVYGSSFLQAMVGLRGDEAPSVRRISRDLGREAAAQRLAAELKQHIDKGGLMEAFARALIYIRHPLRSADERGFGVLKEISAALKPERRIGMAKFKDILKEQFLILEQDEEHEALAGRVLAQNTPGVKAVINRLTWGVVRADAPPARKART
jgi:hypothetical protein